MSLFKKNKILVTHNGTFHADDLFACATLTLWFKKNKQPFKIIRTRDRSIIERADIVVDVGGECDPSKNRYDHHQKEGSGSRANGIPYASFGLVWKQFGMELCGNNPDVWNLIDTHIAAPIDAVDNGVDVVTPKFEGIMPYSGERTFLIYSPTWQEDESMFDTIFYQQVEKISHILEREIKVARDDSVGKSIIFDAYEKSVDKRLIIIEKDFPRYLYQSVLSMLPEPLYLVYPSSHSNTWKVEAISKPNTLESRKLFPESWRGYMDNDSKLVEATGVNDAMFCHKSGFLITVGSREGALKLAEKALLA